MFWLSHHPHSELDRCYSLGSVHFCARCVGTYPVMGLFLGLQIAWHFPLETRWDIPVGLGLLIPATLDWAWGRFQPHRFSNAWRTFTGGLLGLGLARSVYIHFHRPLPLLLCLQAMLVTVVALPVILTNYRRRRRN